MQPYSAMNPNYSKGWGGGGDLHASHRTLQVYVFIRALFFLWNPPMQRTSDDDVPAVSEHC